MLATATAPFQPRHWAHRLVRRAARRYYAGPALADALHVRTSLRDRGFVTTIGYWNADGDTHDAVAAANLTTLDALSGSTAEYVSVKPWAFDFDRATYRTLLDAAQRTAVPLHMDSLEWDWVDHGFDMLAAAPAPVGFVGCTLPARWGRSLVDAERAAALGLAVRVVKGQCPGPDAPDDVRRHYLAIVERAAAAGAPLRIATHDARLARGALTIAHRHNAPAALEALYGLPVAPVLRVARAWKAPVRLYIPYGAGYLPYSLGRLRRSPRSAWWLLKDALLTRNRL